MSKRMGALQCCRRMAGKTLLLLAVAAHGCSDPLPILPGHPHQDGGVFVPEQGAPDAADAGQSVDTTPADTAVPPTATINGSWVGTFSRETQRESVSYDTTMLFNRMVSSDGAIRGNTVGVALGSGPLSNDALTEYPHFLFAGGFTFSDATVTNAPAEADTPLTAVEQIVCEVPNPRYPSIDGGVWVVGRFGTNDYFLQYAYDSGAASNPDGLGAGCLYYSYDKGAGVAKLTGEIQFGDFNSGSLVVDLAYSPDNARAATMETLGLYGEDGSVDAVFHLWSNNNSGISMSYTRETTSATSLAVVENSIVAESCGAQLSVNQVEGLNLFTVDTITPHVADCNVDSSSTIDVELAYGGLGFITDVDGDDAPEYFQLIKNVSTNTNTIFPHAFFNYFETFAVKPPSAGQAKYDADCAGCHRAGSYDDAGPAGDLIGSGNLLASDLGILAPSMSGLLLTDQEITDLAFFLDVEMMR